MSRNLALVAVLALGGTASAGSPKPAHRVVTAPGGDKRLAALVTERAPQILACAGGALLKGHVRATFDYGQRARQIVVDADGDHPFEKCVATTLRGRAAHGGGPNGPVELAFTIEEVPAVAPPSVKPVKQTPLKPAPLKPAPLKPAPVKPGPSTTTTAPASELTSCRVDADCTLYFRLASCTPGDPMAVNAKQLDAARLKFPMRHLECAMGGPQFDELRERDEGRYSAACVKTQCVVSDKGPQPTMQERMHQDPRQPPHR
ncbi:MAG TPA: hypothetical protein VGM39_12635 [Kofleriaceae bacterium]